MKVLLGIINKLGEFDLTKASQEKLLNLTDFWIYNATQNCNLDLTVEYFNTEQDCIEYATSGTFNFVIGSAAGHLLRPGNADNLNVLEETIKLCQQSDGLVGHIMANPNRVPYFYDEYWCINLTVYRAINMPKWEVNDDTVFPSFSKSNANFHSNYTPYYLEPSTPNFLGLAINIQSKSGTGLIKAWLENGFKVINFDKKIRKLKHHLYPEHSIELNQYLNSEIKVGELKQELQHQYFESIDYEHAKDCIFLFNTDTLDFEVPNQPIDNLISVCAAFRPYIILNKSGFNKNTVVKFIDYSPISLRFKEWLVKNWDGSDILKATVEFENVVGKKLNWNKPFNLTYEESYNQVIETFGNQSNWLVFWNKYRNLKHEFHLLDLVEDTDKVLNLVGEGNNYLYISNSFNTEAGLVKHGRSKLLTKLKQIINIGLKFNIVMDGSDLDHNYPWPDYTKNLLTSAAVPTPFNLKL